MRRLLPFMLIVVATAVSAQAYKWKDASGTVHYSDTPPPVGTGYQSVKTHGSAEPLGPSPVPAPASTAGKAPMPLANTPENRKAVCDNLRRNITMLTSDGPLSTVDKDGKSVPVDDARRKQELATTQDQQKQFCSN